MLINFSNHPSHSWSREQAGAAKEIFGGVLDLPFPEVDPNASGEEVAALADSCVKQINDAARQFSESYSVHITGEFTLVYSIVQLLHRSGINACAATSRRKIKINDDGSKTVYFEFVRFRKYFNNLEKKKI